MAHSDSPSRARAVAMIGISPREIPFPVQGTIPYDFLCTVCNGILSDPVLTGCCGKNVCSVCLSEDQGGVCPHCSAQGLSYVTDQRIKRQIKQLIIYCKHRTEGCLWQGNVEQAIVHLESSDGCQFEKIMCPKKCGEMVVRQNLREHLLANCFIQWEECKFCNSLLPEGSLNNHIESLCPEYTLSCRNECGVTIKRSEVLDHVTVCPNHVVPCPFKDAGCTVTLQRKKKNSHLEESQLGHLSLAYTTLQHQMRDIREEMKSSREETQVLKRELENTTQEVALVNSELRRVQDNQMKLTSMLESELQYFINQPHNSVAKTLSIECTRIQLSLFSNPYNVVLCPGFPLVFRMTMFSHFKSSDKIWYSSPFFVQNGYQMCLAVHPNGDQEGKGTHISVYIHLMAGPNDDSRNWPLLFNDIVTVSLVNQNPHSSKTRGILASRSPKLNKHSFDSEATNICHSYDEYQFTQQQILRNIIFSLRRVNKPIGSIGLAFGYIAMFCAHSSIGPAVLLNDSLVFQLKIESVVQCNVSI